MKFSFTRFAIAFIVIMAMSFGIAYAQEPPGTRPTPCHLATPNNALCVLWVAPEQHVEGVPIVLAITYRVEQQLGSGAFTTIANGISARQLYVQNLAPGTYTFRVYARVGAFEGAASAAGSRAATAPPPTAPNPPTAIQVVKVTISDDHPPVYRIASNGTSLTGTVYGAVPTGRSCGAFVTRWRGVDWHRVEIRHPDEEIFPAEARNDPELIANLAAPCGPAS